MDKDAKKLMRIIEAHGWINVTAKRTGHFQFVHPVLKGRVTIPHRNIKKNIIKSVLKQAGVEGSLSDFRNGRIS